MTEEERHENTRRWKERHPDRVREYNREYYRRNTEKVREYNKAYYDRRREYYAAYNKAYYAAHREQSREKMRRIRTANNEELIREGKRLLDMRKQLDMTQGELAARVGKTQSMVSVYERGICRIPEQVWRAVMRL